MKMTMALIELNVYNIFDTWIHMHIEAQLGPNTHFVMPKNYNVL
jgi:hypothetical protein